MYRDIVGNTLQQPGIAWRSNLLGRHGQHFREPAILLKEGQQQGSIPTHLDPLKTAQVMYQLWLGAALMTKLAQDKAPLHLALETTQQLLQPIQE